MELKAEAPMESTPSDTVEVPLAMLGGAKAGDSIELRVQSVDNESGMAILSAGTEEPESTGSAIGDAAQMFEE